MSRSTIRGIALGFLAAAFLTMAMHVDSEKKEKPLSLEQLQEQSSKRGYTLVKEKEESKQASHTSPVSNPVPKQAKKTDQAVTGPPSYTLTISSGMSSEEIADILKKEQIIQDPSAFIHYLESNGLSSRIQIGTYILTKDMNLQQIAKTISK
ncbi:endolytic transglycosylase MltG [Bacillus testis]|uniref:endolytic transglycosylase MltG n=1 Tax=Bacillus testis TaxID=1622072 RepID=UPI00067F6A41|nr:endolytic transglycosylase MltG [Bacillus testis]